MIEKDCADLCSSALGQCHWSALCLAGTCRSWVVDQYRWMAPISRRFIYRRVTVTQRFMPRIAEHLLIVAGHG